MITEHLVDISRLQFAVTALYHFIRPSHPWHVATCHHGVGVCGNGHADLERHDPLLGQIVWH